MKNILFVLLLLLSATAKSQEADEEFFQSLQFSYKPSSSDVFIFDHDAQGYQSPGVFISRTVGCVPPKYVPKLGMSTIAMNACFEIWCWDGEKWVQPPSALNESDRNALDAIKNFKIYQNLDTIVFDGLETSHVVVPRVPTFNYVGRISESTMVTEPPVSIAYDGKRFAVSDGQDWFPISTADSTTTDKKPVEIIALEAGIGWGLSYAVADPDVECTAISGQVDILTASSAARGDMAKIVISGSGLGKPKGVALFPANDEAAIQFTTGVYGAVEQGGDIVIRFVSAPQPSSLYKITYQVIY